MIFFLRFIERNSQEQNETLRTCTHTHTLTRTDGRLDITDKYFLRRAKNQTVRKIIFYRSTRPFSESITTTRREYPSTSLLRIQIDSTKWLFAVRATQTSRTITVCRVEYCGRYSPIFFLQISRKGYAISLMFS